MITEPNRLWFYKIFHLLGVEQWLLHLFAWLWRRLMNNGCCCISLRGGCGRWDFRTGDKIVVTVGPSGFWLYKIFHLPLIEQWLLHLSAWLWSWMNDI